MTEESTRVLGTACYSAHWVQRSNLVKLTARGTLPCFNYEAQLVQGPEDVFPPIHYMYFYVQDICMMAEKPFDIEVVFPAPSGQESVTVIDAGGEQHVPVKQQFEERKISDLVGIGGDHIVYAKLPVSVPHNGCIVVPEDFVVSAIHYRVFGPASKADCDAYLLRNCGQAEPVVELKGGEIPWPLAK